MANDQTLYEAPQSVEPDEGEPVAVEGYEPPPGDDSGGGFESSGFPIPLRLIGIIGGGLLVLILVIFFTKQACIVNIDKVSCFKFSKSFINIPRNIVIVF